MIWRMLVCHQCSSTPLVPPPCSHRPSTELNGIRVLCKLSRLGCSAWNVTALGETIQHDGTSYSYKAVSRGVLPYLQDTPRKRKLEAIVRASA